MGVVRLRRWGATSGEDPGEWGSETGAESDWGTGTPTWPGWRHCMWLALVGSEGGGGVEGCAMEDLESQIKGFGFGGSKSGEPLGRCFI